MEVSKTKLRLNAFYKSEDKQYVFLRRLALTYRANLPLLSELFQIPEEELKDKLFKYNPGVHGSLLYLFYHDITDQEYAKNRIVLFYQRLLSAVLDKNRKLQKELIDYIADVKMKTLIKNREPQTGWSDDDILTMLNYQLKYALTMRDVAGMVGFHHASYQYRIAALLESDPKLKERYERLTEFNLAMRDKAAKSVRG